MNKRKQTNGWTNHQIAAFIANLVLAIWGLSALWLQTTRPRGANDEELLFLGTLTAMFLGVLPLYAMRIRWGYVGGILASLGMFAGLAKSLLDQSYFFSMSTYNLSVVLAYIIALANIILSALAISQRPRTGWRSTASGVSGILLVTAAVAVLLAANMDTLNDHRFRIILYAFP